MSRHNLAEFFPAIAEHALRLLAISPFEQADFSLCRSWIKSGAAAALDIGRDSEAWPGLLHKLGRDRSGLLGVRLPDNVEC